MGELSMKLFHFSENPNITYFEPHVPKTNSKEESFVWAIDEEHAPHYYFPRECPRVAFWTSSETTGDDLIRFFGHTSVNRIIAIETSWLKRIRETELYAYTLPSETFECFDVNAGYYVSRKAVTPLSVDPVGDLLDRLVQTNIELRITPTLWKLRDEIIHSSVSFSIIRMRNASH
jgi:hypothetical protein